MTSRPLRIVVSGMIAAVPHHGGATWAVLQYLVGLDRLGHEVWFVEPVVRARLSPPDAPAGSSDNARYLHDVLAAHGLAHRWALALDDGELVGPAAPTLRAPGTPVDVVVDIAGGLYDTDLLARAPVRIYLDLDPCFTQMWQAYDGIDMHLGGHTHFVTVGLAIGGPACTVPTLGLHWITTLPPVVLDLWPLVAPRPDAAFTTIANWRGYGSVVHDGLLFGQKAHSVRELALLPTRTSERLEVALSIDPGEPADLHLLHEQQWTLVDPATVAGDPDRYRTYVASSKGEIGLAKSGYVRSRCGWFSDRSACYLASGRPVVAHDTGAAALLGLESGFVVFDDTASAVEALARVATDYERHCRAARALAERQLDAATVLARLLDEVGAR